jgi:2-succinyl-5-enolpyruvyl-6-hydroxy-3-cyclohexene-1-carboxylate synthase
MTTHGSHPLLRAFCDELARCGVRDACTSPGSRSSPLVLALTREPGIRCWSHVDERCAAFFALGAAKVTRRPAAVTCTSGTAAANLAPAVIEAWHARVPLIVLTADRPPELRDNGAGQAIDQLGLYGTAAKWFVEVGVEEASPETLRWIRTLACRAYVTATDGRPGPVHLNFPLREPLVAGGPLPACDDGRPDGRPWVRSARTGAAAEAPAALPVRGVVVAGRWERDRELGPTVARFAEQLGWPLLADPLSGARRGAAAIAAYDLLLRSPAVAAELAPEAVIRVGDLPTSKPLRGWLAALEAPQWTLDPERAWQDPAGVVSDTIAADPVATLRRWTPPEPPSPGGPPSRAWLDRWRTLDTAAAAGIAATLVADELSEPRVAAELGAWLPEEAILFVASSMPVRDIEEFWPVRDDPPEVLCNRGANGIDGTVSAAFGAAGASGRPVVLLIGDVALLHDLGGLLAARRLGVPLTIVLLNNDGGGIFHFLPIAGETDAFEEHVATPHGIAFAAAAAVYDCAHTSVTTAGALRASVEASLGATGTQIIEVRTDRVANRALHAAVADAVLARLEQGASSSGG